MNGKAGILEAGRITSSEHLQSQRIIFMLRVANLLEGHCRRSVLSQF
jgi:hypothetical protein